MEKYKKCWCVWGRRVKYFENLVVLVLLLFVRPLVGSPDGGWVGEKISVLLTVNVRKKRFLFTIVVTVI